VTCLAFPHAFFVHARNPSCRREDVAAVLKREFRRGVDLVYESVGGDMFQTCLKALAPKVRLPVRRRS
jgi:NADPH-dependent curcumin reductase CurA